MKKFLLLLFPLLLISAGCNKASKAKWYFYDETKCADRWTKTNNNEALKENVTSYLASQNITIYEMEIFIHQAADECSECSCKSGRRYKVKVKKSDQSKIKEEGFYQ